MAKFDAEANINASYRKMPVWTKEFTDDWVKDRRSGSQCTADKKFPPIQLVDWPQKWRLPMAEKRIIAKCSCGQSYQAWELNKVETHINANNCAVHQWVFVADIILEYDPKVSDG